MKAIVMDTHGGPEVLILKDIDEPRPGPHEVLVDIAAAGVNFMDTGTRRGVAGPTDLPFTPGVEGAGTVAEIGEGVTNVSVGDRVAWYYAWQSYAAKVVAPADQLVPLPDDINFETAASLMMQGLTASNFVFETLCGETRRRCADPCRGRRRRSAVDADGASLGRNCDRPRIE